MKTDNSEAMRLADYARGDEYQRAAEDAVDLIRQQSNRIAELEAERDKLLQGIEQGLDEKTLLTDFALREGGLYAGIQGGAAGLLAAGFAEQFVEVGGVNYVEISFTHPKTGPMAVTLQRTQGKTPHQLRAEAEAERDRLREEVERLRPNAERYEWLRDNLESEWAICEWQDDPDGLGYYRDARASHIVDAAIDLARTHKETP